ncbi:hypothetical protein GB882_05865 [Georgenia ruanii]|uniref:DUF2569 family protein n=1 Tax=Georgenia ruanii TaxID=348442 RepID=A0A7J9UU84_9MICO|nr:hypothetical protein [Georgenia ruanii]
MRRRIPPPRSILTSRTLWLLSFVAGLVAVGFAWVDRTAGQQRLTELVTELDPTRDPASLESLGRLIFWGSLAAVLLVIVVEALLLRTMMGRRAWARIALLVVLVVHAAVMVLADAYLAAPGTAGAGVRWPLVAQLLLAAAAWIVSLAPSATRWFRAEPASRA